MVEEDLKKIKEAAKKDCKSFLKYVNENYAPEDRKLTLSEDDLKDGKLKRLMTTKFTLIFHPDKNVKEERQVQILREEVMKFINIYIEEFK